MTLKTSLYLFTICLINLLSSCANAPIIVNYYTLDNMDTRIKNSTRKVINEQQPLVLLSSIKLADFLTTGALVLQLKSHQIQLSNQHRWADNLSETLTRNLLTKLARKMPNYDFERNDLRWKNKSQATIDVTFEQFTILADKNTLTSGSFWLFNKHNKLVHKQSFSIRIPLMEDGYNHAVVQLESSLTTLTQQIQSSLRFL